MNGSLRVQFAKRDYIEQRDWEVSKGLCFAQRCGYWPVASSAPGSQVFLTWGFYSAWFKPSWVYRHRNKNADFHINTLPPRMSARHTLVSRSVELRSDVHEHLQRSPHIAWTCLWQSLFPASLLSQVEICYLITVGRDLCW